MERTWEERHHRNSKPRPPVRAAREAITSTSQRGSADAQGLCFTFNWDSKAGMHKAAACPEEPWKTCKRRGLCTDSVFSFHLVNRHEIFSRLSMYSLTSLVFLFPVLPVKKYYFGLNYVEGLGQSGPDWKKIIEVNTKKPFWNSWKNFGGLPYDILLFTFSPDVLDTCWPRMHL